MNIKRITISVVILVFLCAIQGMAEVKNDVVKISFANETAIEILGVDINKYQIDTAFIAESIDRFFGFCKSSNVKDLMQQSPKQIEMKVAEETKSRHSNEPAKNAFYVLSIDEREIPNQIVSSHDFKVNLYYLQKHELVFSNRYFSFKIRFDQIEQLHFFKTAEANKVMADVMYENYLKKSNWIEKQHYVVDERFVSTKMYENEKSARDQIELALGTGLGNVKNTWVANLNTSMVFSFKRKGIVKNSYGINYEWQYDFSNPEERNINQFIDLKYSHDFSKDPKSSDAYCFSLGYLVNKQGDLYNHNTFRLGISRSLGKNFSGGPRLYFNDFFKEAIPTVVIGIVF